MEVNIIIHEIRQESFSNTKKDTLMTTLVEGIEVAIPLRVVDALAGGGILVMSRNGEKTAVVLDSYVRVIFLVVVVVIRLNGQ
ncbi:unnamed protein product [Soboliphyme baturini]|uniref:DUF2642 domain-containing protein n=1 Tax=Soboliphyme baturini TaxID=241478 RepID=A0A183INA7_9BILA|nr:unnamed protein product [Soboliphyme baturini]